MGRQQAGFETLHGLHPLRRTVAGGTFVRSGALVGGVVVLVHAGGDATMRAVGIFMAALACVYAALAFLVRKAPLTLSIAGFLLSWLCLGGLPGLVIVGAMALSSTPPFARPSWSRADSASTRAVSRRVSRHFTARRVARSGDRRGHGAESLVRRAVCPHYEPCRIVGTKNR